MHLAAKITGVINHLLCKHNINMPIWDAVDMAMTSCHSFHSSLSPVLASCDIAPNSLLRMCIKPILSFVHVQVLHQITGHQDDRLSKVLASTEQLVAILPVLTLMSNPFQSASSLTSKEGQLQASDVILPTPT